jgi:hypothetical protein
MSIEAYFEQKFRKMTTSKLTLTNVGMISQ